MLSDHGSTAPAVGFRRDRRVHLDRRHHDWHLHTDANTNTNTNTQDEENEPTRGRAFFAYTQGHKITYAPAAGAEQTRADSNHSPGAWPTQRHRSPPSRFRCGSRLLGGVAMDSGGRGTQTLDAPARHAGCPCSRRRAAGAPPSPSRMRSGVKHCTVDQYDDHCMEEVERLTFGRL